MKKYLTWVLLGATCLTISGVEAFSEIPQQSSWPNQSIQGVDPLQEQLKILNEGRRRVSNNQDQLDTSKKELRTLEKQYYGEIVRAVQNVNVNAPQSMRGEIENLVSIMTAKLSLMEGLEGQILTHQTQINSLMEQRKSIESKIQVLQKTLEDTLNKPVELSPVISVEQSREFEDKLSSATLAAAKLNGEIESLEAEVAGLNEIKRPLKVALDQINNGDKSNPCLPPSVLPTVKVQIEKELAEHNQTIQGKNAEISSKVIEKEGIEKSKERTMALQVEAKEKALRDAQLGHEEKVNALIRELEGLAQNLAQNRNQENDMRVNLSSSESKVDGVGAELELLSIRLQGAVLTQSRPGSSAIEMGNVSSSVIALPEANINTPLIDFSENPEVQVPSSPSPGVSDGLIPSPTVAATPTNIQAMPSPTISLPEIPAPGVTTPQGLANSNISPASNSGDIKLGEALPIEANNVTLVSPPVETAPTAPLSVTPNLTDNAEIKSPLAGPGIIQLPAPKPNRTPTPTGQGRGNSQRPVATSPAKLEGTLPSRPAQVKRSYADVVRGNPNTLQKVRVNKTRPKSLKSAVPTKLGPVTKNRGGTTPAPLGKR